ncbi:MAG: hypothetical protein QOF70_7236, partial [Acetobacteraceae bacterium]|nr:hypothetical protein [Acetobacteraceae bacterium]
MLNDLSSIVQPEDIDARPCMIARPFLAAMKDNVISFRDHPHELDIFAGIIAGRLFKIIDETGFAVRYAGIVLDVITAGILLYCFPWTALIEHQI